MTEYIKREDAIEAAQEGVDKWDGGCNQTRNKHIRSAINCIPDADVMEIPKTGIGDMSDGYHTFNSLYYQRAVLFAALVKAHRDRAWKSRRHSDGELPFGKENYFIVGIDTPEGSYTYHYHGEYWDMFDCEELERGKEWDGHTDKDVTRLFSLPAAGVRENRRGRWVGIHAYCKHLEEITGDKYVASGLGNYIYCDQCWEGSERKQNFCPNCGAAMFKFDFGEACKQAMMEHEEV